MAGVLPKVHGLPVRNALHRTAIDLEWDDSPRGQMPGRSGNRWMAQSKSANQNAMKSNQVIALGANGGTLGWSAGCGNDESTAHTATRVPAPPVSAATVAQRPSEVAKALDLKSYQAAASASETSGDVLEGNRLAGSSILTFRCHA